MLQGSGSNEKIERPMGNGTTPASQFIADPAISFSGRPAYSKHADSLQEGVKSTFVRTGVAAAIDAFIDLAEGDDTNGDSVGQKPCKQIMGCFQSHYRYFVGSGPDGLRRAKTAPWTPLGAPSAATATGLSRAIWPFLPESTKYR